MTAITNPGERQVLVNFGNRYAVFGPEVGLPNKVLFDADHDSEVLPRVADESEIAGERIVQTLRVHGLQRVNIAETDAVAADVVLSDNEGNRVFVEVKAREHAPRSKELNIATERVREAESKGKLLEVWHFNIERLSLTIQAYRNGMLQFHELPVIDVWEKTADSLFRRERVVQEVELWVQQLDELYSQIRIWLAKRPDLKVDMSRSVTMSEELMRQFNVADRELPVMDILSGEQVVASLLPRGLWLIGAWGRIDFITPETTLIFIQLRNKEEGTYSWHFSSPNNRRMVQPLTEDSLQNMLVSK